MTMPLREYICNVCGYAVERVEFVLSEEPPTCPRCLEEHQEYSLMERVISVPAPAQFIGSGWTRPTTYQKPRRATEIK